MVEQYNKRGLAEMNTVDFLLSSGGFEKGVSTSTIDSQIDKDHSSVDLNI